MAPRVPFLVRPAALIVLVAIVTACPPPPEPAPPMPANPSISRVVLEIDAGGTMQRVFVDPTKVDAVFFDDSISALFYTGGGTQPTIGRRGDRLPPLTLPEGAVLPPPSPCIHCAAGRCVCACITRARPPDRLPPTRIGIVVRLPGGSEQLYWLNPERVGAIFLTPAARAQFYSGEPIIENLEPGAERLVASLPSAVAELAPGQASLHTLP